MRLSMAPESAPTWKEDKIFSVRRASAAATTVPVETTRVQKRTQGVPSKQHSLIRGTVQNRC